MSFKFIFNFCAGAKRQDGAQLEINNIYHTVLQFSGLYGTLYRYTYSVWK